jgi:hypothetical protein
MNPYLYTWTALALVVLALAAYRISLGSHEDLVLHVAKGGGALPAAQQARSRKIGWLDRWGPALTVLVVLYGLTLLGVYFYHVWFSGYQIPH